MSKFPPPSDFLLDHNSGLYFKRTQGINPQTGVNGETITWFYPETGGYQEQFIPLAPPQYPEQTNNQTQQKIYMSRDDPYGSKSKKKATPYVIGGVVLLAIIIIIANISGSPDNTSIVGIWELTELNFDSDFDFLPNLGADVNNRLLGIFFRFNENGTGVLEISLGGILSNKNDFKWRSSRSGYVTISFETSLIEVPLDLRYSISGKNLRIYTDDNRYSGEMKFKRK